jgi:HmuY protein
MKHKPSRQVHILAAAFLLVFSACITVSEVTDAGTEPPPSRVDSGADGPGPMPDDPSPVDSGTPDSGPRFDAGGVRDAGVGADASVEAPRCGATAVSCQDESIAQLKFFAVVNDAGVVEEGTTAGEFTTKIDARAGGLMTNTSFIYGRFTNTGFQKVELSDEGALASLDWDIAVRRYLIRLNSGVSGPSCVQGAPTEATTSFESLTKAPSSLSARSEAYFTSSCDYVPDTSGINAPSTVLSSFWKYASCIQMTDAVFVIHLRDGRYVKLQVKGYYDLAAQAECNDAGVAPIPNGAGTVRIRWAFLDKPSPSAP